MNGFGKFLKDWWPVLVVCSSIALALAETRWQVQSLMERKTAETEQWRRINANEDRSKENYSRLSKVEEHITPEAIQRWGEIQRIVEDDHRDLKEHLRNH